MLGGECLLRTLVASQVDVCFMNPGTSEMQFVAALDRVPEMRGVLCLVEGVCAGAADGYARMLRRPASTLLHLGPGLANGLSNFHNARKARSPIVNIVGEHSTQHLPYDAPLTADIEAIARPVSAWVKTLASADQMGVLAGEAVAAALVPPGGVATLIVPADFSWSPAGQPGAPATASSRRAPDARAIREAARILRLGRQAGILLSGNALLEEGIRAAARIQAATGARVFANRYAARLRRGRDFPNPLRLPYFPEPAEAALEGLTHIVLVEAEAPVSFFGYPNRRSTIAPENCLFHRLASEQEESVQALEAVADELGAPTSVSVPRLEPTALETGGALSPETIGAVVAALLPEDAIVSDEMVSAGEAVNSRLLAAAPHDLLPVAGGSIGQGLPVGLGAAVACPDRKVVCLEADGSGMYSLQALWTMARERLNVTTVIFANSRYRILDVEMRRTEAGPVGERAEAMIDLRRPALDWVALASGLGVQAARAQSAHEFADLFSAAMCEDGPFVIEAVL